jgi:hypothetical protein
MNRLNPGARARLCCSVAIALFAVACAAPAHAEPNSRATPTPAKKIPRRGSIYVDVTTDATGAVSRLEFINKVPVEIQEWIKRETLGKHFGIPNHTYRRAVDYELEDPPQKRKKP